MLYNKKNYILMGISALLIVLAPIVCLSGFILMVYAILVHGGGDKSTEKEAKE